MTKPMFVNYARGEWNGSITIVSWTDMGNGWWSPTRWNFSFEPGLQIIHSMTFWGGRLCTDPSISLPLILEEPLP